MEISYYYFVKFKFYPRFAFHLQKADGFFLPAFAKASAGKQLVQHILTMVGKIA